MYKKAVMILVLSCSLAFASAQEQKPVNPEKWDIFVGYSLERVYLSSASFFVPPKTFPMNLNGGQGSATYFFNRHLGATAEMTGYTNDSMGATWTSQGYLFGPTVRFGPKDSRYSFFAHQLFGFSHVSVTPDNGGSCGDNTGACKANPFTEATGGGVDVKLSKHFSVRPAQLEYFSGQVDVQEITGIPTNVTNFGGLKVGIRVLRYSAGAVIRF